MKPKLFKHQRRKMPFKWIIRMAWRDSRKHPAKLFLFIASIILGIAALTGINTFNRNIQHNINDEAKSLLTADLQLDSHKEIADSTLKIIRNAGTKMVRKTSFSSMVLFPGKGTRLVQVNGIDPGYPVYGNLVTSPDGVMQSFFQGRNALVDKNLMLQLDARRGDSIKIGALSFRIAGVLQEVPGQISLFSSITRPVFIPMQYVDATGLLREGSRIKRNFYYKFSGEKRVQSFIDQHKDRFKQEDIDIETVEERKEAVGRAFEDLSGFLNLVAFIALMLGCLGVAASVQVYIQGKRRDVAVLRCLGAGKRDAFLIYLFQITVMGLIGAISGAMLGIAFRQILPYFLQSLLPVDMGFGISWLSILHSIALGTGLAFLFALLPLSGTVNISPLMAIRADFDSKTRNPAYLKYLVYLLLFAFVFVFVIIQTGNYITALYFSAGLLLALFILYVTGTGLILLSRKITTSSANFELRQGVANLSRPGNQTRVLILSIGMGTALLSSLFFIQDMLLKKLSLSGGENRPDMILFDIRPEQREEVKGMLSGFDMPVYDEVPLVPMHIEKVRGIPVSMLKEHGDTLGISDHVAEREYRVTYRDSLIDSETLSAGRFIGRYDGEGPVPVSVAQRFIEDANAAVGDKLVFNVQGLEIEAYIASIRDVDWSRVQTNFIIVFPENVLEKAPRTFALLTRSRSAKQSAAFQQAMVEKMPGISIIDIDLVINTLDDVLGKVTFAIRFLTLFSIVTGIVVLLAALVTTRYQRFKESALLKTLGAVKKQVFKITAFEYIFCGAIGVLSGLILGLTATWILSIYYFRMVFVPPLLNSLLIFVIVTALVVIAGVMNIRGILNRPPLEVLRKED